MTGALLGDPVGFTSFYVDTAVPFGLRHGASACQRTTEAVVSLAKQDHDTTAHPYIDDTVAAALPEVADGQYSGLLALMAMLGLMAAPHKSVPPCFRSDLDWRLYLILWL